ncbi:MAG: hypothetical protein CME67_06645, partial [Halobacteriovoraceae bacterium]|nr:hypothetical protein [Halobacteriovoraceae bacterium]
MPNEEALRVSIFVSISRLSISSLKITRKSGRRSNGDGEKQTLSRVNIDLICNKSAPTLICTPKMVPIIKEALLLNAFEIHSEA